VYRGRGAAEHLLNALQAEERKIRAALASPEAMVTMTSDRRTHNASTNCHMCERPLDGDSVCDHCHITGKYRGVAHNACNLKLRLHPKLRTSWWSFITLGV